MKYIVLLLGMILAVSLTAQITLIKKNESCAGRKDGRIEVQVEGNPANLTYKWTRDGKPYPGEKIISGLAPGDYSVTVTAQYGCMAFKSAKIWAGGAISVDISAKLIGISPQPLPCGTRPTFTYRLTANATGGTPPYYCSWGNLDPGDGTCSITVSGKSIRASVFMADSSGCGDSDGWEKQGVTKICPKDPNDITGPEGYDTSRWVSVHDAMEYHIRFENDAIFATSSAASVLVSVPIDDDIDPYSFRLGAMGFGDKIIDVPVNATYFQQRLDYSQDLGFKLDVTAGLDVPNNRFFWLMQTIDPATGQPPLDPTFGFLPVNDTLTGSGEGFVSFVCKPKDATLTGENIEQQASIIFDVNDPVVTNTWTNRVDAFGPVSEAGTVADTFYTNVIPFSWMMTDDPGGCGVKHGEVLISTDKVDFQSQGFMTDSNHLTLTLDWGKTYYYKIRGTDFVDNQEQAVADSFYIIPRRTIEFISPDRETYCIGDSLFIDVNLISIPEVDLYISTDSGATYLPLAYAVNSWPYRLVLDSSFLDTHLFIKARNEESNLEEISNGFVVHILPDIHIQGDPATGCDNEILFVEAFGAYTWLWWPDTIMGNPLARFTNVYADVSQPAWVRGTGVDGCSTIDSIWLTVFPTSIDTLAQPLCEGDSILIGGAWVAQEGYYAATFVNANGCDSVVVSDVYFSTPCIWNGGPLVYVDIDATGENNGTSWANAFNDLNDAIYVAGRYENVQAIWVAEGTYSPHPTRRDTSFILLDSIKIYGGFLGGETNLDERTADPELVKLSGDINIPDTLWDNSYHTVVFSSACKECLIDGVTITYGHADESNNGNNIGAGVLNKGIGHFNNVIFERNYATDQGAALHSSGAGANLIIENCLFRLNSSSLGRDVVNFDGAQVEFRAGNSIH